MIESIYEALLNMQIYEWGLLGCFIVAAGLRIIYILMFYGKVAFLKNRQTREEKPISLLVTCRNDEETIKENLPQLLSYKGSGYEVVVVDNSSQDDSLTLLNALEEQNVNLKVSFLNQEIKNSGKMARNIALKAAKYDWTMVISPSIKRYSNLWLERISGEFEDSKEVVVNYSNLVADKTLYNILYRVEFLFQQLNSMGAILNGLPYVVEEENVAFKKQRYFGNGGFRENMVEPFANLELVINNFIKKNTTAVLLSEETAIWKEERVTKDCFMDLLTKELRLTRKISFVKRFWMGIFRSGNILCLPLAIILIILAAPVYPIIITLLALIIIPYSLIIKKILSRLNESKLFLPSLLFGLFLPFFKLFYNVSSQPCRQRKRWKKKK